MFSIYHCRIREKRQLITIESREKRRVQRSRLGRTAKKVDAKKMEASMEELGVVIDNKDEVSSVYMMVPAYILFVGLYKLRQRVEEWSGAVFP